MPGDHQMGGVMKVNSYLIGSALVAALGGLLFGFDTAVISGAEQTLERLYQPAAGLGEKWEAFWHGFLVASALIGTIVGAVAVGKPADRFGPPERDVRLGDSLFRFGGWQCAGVGLVFVRHLSVHWRTGSRRCIGGGADVHCRDISGRTCADGSWRWLNSTSCWGFCLRSFRITWSGLQDLGEVEWRWMFGVEAFPAAVYFVLLTFTPRSPRWLLAQRREDEAREVLRRVGTDSTGTSVEVELKEIKNSLDIERHNLGEPFFQRKYMTPIHAGRRDRRIQSIEWHQCDPVLLETDLRECGFWRECQLAELGWAWAR